VSADSKSEPSAGKATIGCRFYLHERIEDDLALIGGNPLAGIDNVGHQFSAAPRDADGDAAARRELQRIGHQVADDLADPGAIAKQRTRHVVANLVDQRQSLRLRRRLKLLHDLAHQAARTERSKLQRETARFDTRQVENVVSDLQQRASRRARDAESSHTFRRQRLFPQQAQRRHEAVQRRAHFVAHGGDEQDLAVADFLDGGVGLPQRVFQVLHVERIALLALQQRLRLVLQALGHAHHGTAQPFVIGAQFRHLAVRLAADALQILQPPMPMQREACKLGR
jgi:hypothetical protein